MISRIRCWCFRGYGTSFRSEAGLYILDYLSLVFCLFVSCTLIFVPFLLGFLVGEKDKINSWNRS